MPLWASMRSLAVDTASSEVEALDMAAFEDRRNFQYIYATDRRRSAFRDFLANVFRLYPEDKLDQLIARHVSATSGDR